MVDSMAAGLRLCGFPEKQLDTSHVGAPEYLSSVGYVHLSQRILLRLSGDMDRVASIRWVTEPTLPSQRPAHVRFVQVDSRSAFLEGVSLSGDDADFAYAAATFGDGTSDDAVVSVCVDGDWQPANRLVTVP